MHKGKSTIKKATGRAENGYRSVRAYLVRRGYKISNPTIHKYMNTELQLFSIARRRKPDYEYGKPHKVFENILNREFKADSINQKWCTDFTYLFLTDGSKRYNCTMERYYNTLKNKLIYHHYYHYEKELYEDVEEFAYVHYNHERPHSYNNYKTPFEARYEA